MPLDDELVNMGASAQAKFLDVSSMQPEEAFSHHAYAGQDLNGAALSETENLPKFLRTLIRRFERRGYTFLEDLGTGCTRKSLKASHSVGGRITTRVVHFPYEIANLNSICTIINKSKRDIDENEYHISQKLKRHPHISSVIESHDIMGVTVNVESDTDGKSLQSLIESWGPITEDQKAKFYKIFSQIVDAKKFANMDKDILLRNDQPGNYIVNDDLFVVIADLQNARERHSIRDISLPTRDVTAYTHPDLINALFDEFNPAQASRETEVYGVVASMVFALTGQKPFDYEVKLLRPEDEGYDDARIVEVDGLEHRIQLLVEGEPATNISYEDHKKRAKKVIKTLPRWARKIVSKGLLYGEYVGQTRSRIKPYRTVSALEADLEKLDRPSMNKFLKKAYDSMKMVAGIAAGFTFAWLLVWSAQENSKYVPPRPSPADFLRAERYFHYEMNDLLGGFEGKYIMNQLRPYFGSVKKNLPELLEMPTGKRRTMEDEINHYVTHSYNVKWMDKKLVSSWLKACLLHQDLDPEEMYGVDKNGVSNRLKPTFVPRDFVIMSDRLTHGRDIDDNLATVFGVNYLAASMLNITGKVNFAETYASYFCTAEEIKSAMVRSGSIHYFPKAMDGSGGGAIGAKAGYEAMFSPEDSLDTNIGHLAVGYNLALPHKKVELINTAVAIYLLTDKDGHTDLERIKDYRHLMNAHITPLTLPEKQSY
ncbi:hypothetical protein H8D36_05820 [archaeon]|nr:hypothetical protein [archaeon]MBL7057064.1 hypothetical protein [Candidatus Woesearchaeota archaeon]